MRKLTTISLILLFLAKITFGQSISSTVHNLSASGPGSIKAASESEICVFCHTPHNSSPRKPLWNRNDPGSNYTLYSSSTLQANPGQPDGSSILCLSCHDGTIALGNVLSRSSEISFGGITTLPSGSSNLSTDLSDDHPISFSYNSTLASSDGELKDPSTLNGAVHLESGKLQCISCHDPHMNIYGDFLVASQQNSALCSYCHNKDGWSNSSHSTSNQTWNGSGTDPWPNSSYTTVSQNACENCHTSHNAGGSERLVKYSTEEDNCLNCHNGNVASEDIQSQLNKAYSHDVYNYNGTHDPNESSIVNSMHVECSDCHNPHYTSNAAANPPFANGFIAGVKGVNTNGDPIEIIQYEYELCYRCHADSPTKPGSPTSRQIEQNNTRSEFDLNNPSFHPIEGPGKNSNVPSLIPPYTVSSIIYCTDCHASDGTGSPAGPHGSIYPQILKYNYERIVWDKSSFAYELCYNCHYMIEIANSHVPIRNSHSKKASCNVCHDPHGISNSQGNNINNKYLINFNTSIVTPNANGILEYVYTSPGHGVCLLKCHNHDHDANSTY